MGLEHLTVKENKELLKKEKGRGKKKKKVASRNSTEVMGPRAAHGTHTVLVEDTPYWWKTHRIGFSH